MQSKIGALTPASIGPEAWAQAYMAGPAGPQDAEASQLVAQRIAALEERLKAALGRLSKTVDELDRAEAEMGALEGDLGARQIHLVDLRMGISEAHHRVSLKT